MGSIGIPRPGIDIMLTVLSTVNRAIGNEETEESRVGRVVWYGWRGRWIESRRISDFHAGIAGRNASLVCFGGLFSGELFDMRRMASLRLQRFLTFFI